MTQSIRWLQDEIADRMLQKLDIVKMQVKDVLVIPDFSGRHAHFLAKRFPGIRFHSAPESDLSAWERLKLKVSRLWSSGFKVAPTVSLASYQKTGRLDLPNNSVDLVFSVLLIQDLPDPKHFLQECWRVLKEGGLLTLSYLGPDTAKELYMAGDTPQQIALKKLANPWDMHDMGDALLGERFSDPVMDMEFLKLDYESDAVLLADAKALKMIESGIESPFFGDKLPKKLTLEVVYGHAWVIGKHLAKAEDHVAYIDLNQIQRKTRSDSA
ncbi:methyltransferase domain-containing protein [Polynucleobacter sp. AP-Nino-20-G2]|uniref:methyltransferase domain-containing protein n=1 Tax=Polynucleobacter sp. AP-Nino-20-G2 TaxID=2576917 RepID=UPI00203AFA31|nr:methyltransferase domain-containing protein [Polynucleobacter sp. AP-Nino-20-G2]QWE16535.1 methyltransferase domain-containing protein [Polynucleobacter sp. AP-Nino-20-G2]